MPESNRFSDYDNDNDCIRRFFRSGVRRILYSLNKSAPPRLAPEPASGPDIEPPGDVASLGLEQFPISFSKSLFR